MTLDMTEGKPLKLIIKFYLPVVASALFQLLYNYADTMIVGKYVGTNAMAAVGSTGSINFFFVGFLNGCAAGFAIPIAKYFGAKDFEKLRKYSANVMLLSVLASLIMTALTLSLTKVILRIMGTPEELFNYCTVYLYYMFSGIITIMLYNTLAGMLRSVGDSRSPFVCLVIASVINVAMNLLFVCVFKMEVAGVGLATVISQGFSAAYCYMVLKKRCAFMMPDAKELRLQKDVSGELLASGLPMGFQFSITAIGSVALQSAVNSFGAGIVAAVSAATKVRQIAYSTMNSLGTAGATYVSQNLGAGRMDRVKSGMRVLVMCAAALTVFNGLIVHFLGESMMGLFMDVPDPEIIANGMKLLYVGMYLYIFLAFIYLFRAVVQGLGYAKLAVFAGVLELAARFIASFGLSRAYGYVGICFADPLAWIMADCLVIPLYFVITRKKLK